LQVIGSKLIGPAAVAGGENKYRVVLWDGEQLYKNGLLASQSAAPPSEYSVIRYRTHRCGVGIVSRDEYYF
jgi:hypothetical protein